MEAVGTRVCIRQGCTNEVVFKRTQDIKQKRYCSKDCRAKDNHTRNSAKRPSRARNDYYLRTYGITLEERDAMRAAQSYKCAICNGHEEEVGILKVDHNHETGAIRQMLCHFCNVGLGHFQDNQELLIAAAAYLIEHEGED